MTRTAAVLLASSSLLLASPARAEAPATDGSLAEYQRALARMLAEESSPSLARSVNPGLAVPGTSQETTTGCTLTGGWSVSYSSRACAACHAGHDGTRSHPLDVDEDAARSRAQPSAWPRLRPASEVVAAGVFLPDGKVTCLSCHDGNSPWKYRLAIPPEAFLVDAVHPGDATTYGEGPARTTVTRGLKASVARAVLPYGTEVSPAPLCKACHAFD